MSSSGDQDMSINSQLPADDVSVGRERCVICNESYSSPGWVHCCKCKAVVHTSCIVKQLKSIGGEAPKNGINWVHGLLSTMYFRLLCPSCDIALSQNNAHASILPDQPSTDILQAQISSIASRIDDLHKVLMSKVQPTQYVTAKPVTQVDLLAAAHTTPACPAAS